MKIFASPINNTISSLNPVFPQILLCRFHSKYGVVFMKDFIPPQEIS